MMICLWVMYILIEPCHGCPVCGLHMECILSPHDRVSNALCDERDRNNSPSNPCDVPYCNVSATLSRAGAMHVRKIRLDHSCDLHSFPVDYLVH